MKKFYLRILCFSVLVFVLMYVTDVAISSVLKGASGKAAEIEVWNDIYNHNINADLAIYGSSRAWVQIDPNILQDSLGLSTYNFGINGHSFWLQYLRHLKYIEKNSKPKVIVLSVDVFTLVKRKDLYLYEQFLPYMLWDEEIIEYTKSYEGYGDLEYYLPLIRYNRKLSLISDSYKKRNSSPVRNLGFKGNARKWNKVLEKKREKEKDFRLTIDSASIDLLKRFVEECKEDDIQLIFVYTPEHINGQKFVNNRTEIVSTLKDIAATRAAPFLDYSNDTLNLHKKYFYNASHLNSLGATLFSKQLGEDLKSVLYNAKEH